MIFIESLTGPLEFTSLSYREYYLSKSGSDHATLTCDPLQLDCVCLSFSIKAALLMDWYKHLWSATAYIPRSFISMVYRRYHKEQICQIRCPTSQTEFSTGICKVIKYLSQNFMFYNIKSKILCKIYEILILYAQSTFWALS